MSATSKYDEPEAENVALVRRVVILECRTTVTRRGVETRDGAKTKDMENPNARVSLGTPAWQQLQITWSAKVTTGGEKGRV